MTRRELVRAIVIAAGTPLLSTTFMPGEVRASPHTLIPDDVSNGSTPLWACWIGHSTVLMRVGSKWVLTDPVMFDAYGVSVLGTVIGPRRVTQPALTVATCPKPDLILLSHAHVDHMDRRTLAAFSERYPNDIDVLTATNTSDVINDFRWKSLNEIDWHERTSIHGIEIEAIPVRHNGWRWPGDPCRAAGQQKTGRSFNGYHMNAGGVGIVFGGDTAYTDEFKRYAGKVDVALMPIGAYGGCHSLHCTPEEAVEMTRQMEARYLVPIHHNTFDQASEPISEPLQRVQQALVPRPLPNLATRYVGDAIGLT